MTQLFDTCETCASAKCVNGMPTSAAAHRLVTQCFCSTLTQILLRKCVLATRLPAEPFPSVVHSGLDIAVFSAWLTLTSVLAYCVPLCLYQTARVFVYTHAETISTVHNRSSCDQCIVPELPPPSRSTAITPSPTSFPPVLSLYPPPNLWFLLILCCDIHPHPGPLHKRQCFRNSLSFLPPLNDLALDVEEDIVSVMCRLTEGFLPSRTTMDKHVLRQHVRTYWHSLCWHLTVFCFMSLIPSSPWTHHCVLASRTPPGVDAFMLSSAVPQRMDAFLPTPQRVDACLLPSPTSQRLDACLPSSLAPSGVDACLPPLLAPPGVDAYQPSFSIRPRVDTCVVNGKVPRLPHWTHGEMNKRSRGVRGGCSRRSSPTSKAEVCTNLSVLYFNAWSCCNKTLEINDLITDGGFDLVFISETWFRPTGHEPEIAEMTPPGYTLRSIPRLTGPGGGLAIVFKDELTDFLTITSNTTNLTFRSIEVFELRLSLFGQTLIILCVYRPPPSNKNKLTMKMFMDDFPDLLEQYISCEKLIVVGDVNVHFEKTSDGSVLKVKNILESLNLQQLVCAPTQRFGHTLDWVITNDLSIVLDLTVEDKAISDHFCISFGLNLQKLKKQTKTVSSRNWKKVDTVAFKADVSDAFEENDFGVSPADTYNARLNAIVDKHAPMVKRRVTDRASAPWITSEIIESKRERRHAERVWRRTGLTVHRQIFVSQKNRVNGMIREAKRHHLCEKIECADSSRELFQLSNQMMGGNANKVLPHASSPEDLARSFSNFFMSKIEKIREGLNSGVSTPPPPAPDAFAGTHMESFQPVSEEQMRKILTQMPKKSCQLDPIPASLFFECIENFVPVITQIINTSLTTGIVPACFKHALVSPLLKKVNLDPENQKHYRPVSNLPFLSKVLERTVLLQLLSHLQTHDLLEPFQSAYRKSHSTETALIRVVNDLYRASDQGNVSILSLLDLSAAFDTIDHSILCERLSSTFGLAGIVLRWFQSYLADRTQSVVVPGAQSPPSLLKYGVPQGSVLGPVLFTMYTKPLSSIIRLSGLSYHFFADDTQLHDSTKPSNIPSLAQDMKRSIDNVSDWMKGNKLKMNEEKTEIISIGTKSKLEQVTVHSLTFSDCEITFSKSVRNLGVHLDTCLTMENQVNLLCKTLYFQLRRIGKIRKYLTLDAAKKLAVSFILSRLDFCNSLLCGIPDEKLNKLQRIQNRAARMVLRRSRHESATLLLRTLHWLPVKARIEYKIATLCFQCIYTDTMPGYLSDLVPMYRPARALRSQDTSLLVVPRYKLETYGKRSFAVFGPTVWNSLPPTLRLNQSLTTFKKHLKTFLFQKYLTD